jgi:hypothetical protein
MIISGFSPFNHPAVPTPDRALEAAVATECTLMQSLPAFYKVRFVVRRPRKVLIIGGQAWTLDDDSRAHLKTFKYLVSTKPLTRSLPD